MSFAIRAMQPADLDEVLTIAAAAAEAPQWARSAYASYLAPDAACPALLRTALVAAGPAHSGARAVLAFACATLLRVPDSAGAQNLAQLDSMAVHPSHRRRGLGAALLREVLSWAAQNGAGHFSLEVRASNAPAIALYQRLGLRPEGRRPGYYTHPEEDALLLGIPVTRGGYPALFHRESG
jgi:ribosomal-protein-alanine N-acetyltransferase